MRSFRTLMCALSILVFVIGVEAHAGAPILINHQGRLLDAADHPVTGSRTLTFRIFDNPASMTPLWDEVHAGVPIAEGLFNVTLGSITPLSSEVLAPLGSSETPTAIERYLEVQVDADPPLSPRSRLVAAPYAVAASRVSGDLETQPGVLLLKQGATYHIRAAVEVGHAEIVLHPDDGGGDPVDELTLATRKNKSYQKMTDKDIASRTAEVSADSGGSSLTLESDDDGDGTSERGVAATNGAYVRARKVTVHGWDSEPGQSSEFSLSADSASSSLNLDQDSDGDGLADNSSSQTVRSTGVSLAIKTKGTSAQRFALNLGAGTDSSMIESTFDENGDGHAERQFNTLSNASKCRTVCLADLNSDGNPEYSASQIADAAGARLAIKTKGTSAHRHSVDLETGLDSSIISNGSDEDADGRENVMFSSVSNVLKCRASCIFDLDDDGRADHAWSATVDSVRSRTILAADVDLDGTPDNLLTQTTDDIGASSTIQSRFGSGPRQTVSQDGTFSHASHRCATDVDGDGTPESSTENYSDATTARIQAVRASINSGERAQLQADDSGPSLTLDEDDITRILVRPDSGIQQYDAAGIKTADIDADGDAYLAGNLKFGAVAGNHRIDVQGGAYCDGTNWVNASDANAKENFETVDGREILNKLSHLDITRWNYKGQSNADHIGPTAQDFREVFGVGTDDKSISTIDPSGIALAAIKELNKQNQELRDQNQGLQIELKNLKKAVEKLQSRK